MTDNSVNSTVDSVNTSASTTTETSTTASTTTETSTSMLDMLKSLGDIDVNKMMKKAMSDPNSMVDLLEKINPGMNEETKSTARQVAQTMSKTKNRQKAVSDMREAARGYQAQGQRMRRAADEKKRKEGKIFTAVHITATRKAVTKTYGDSACPTAISIAFRGKESSVTENSPTHLKIGPWADIPVTVYKLPAGAGAKNRRASRLLGQAVTGDILIVGDNVSITAAQLETVEKLLIGTTFGPIVEGSSVDSKMTLDQLADVLDSTESTTTV